MGTLCILKETIDAMNVSFTSHQEKYIQDQVATGDFQNASEVVRDALRLHQVYRHRFIEELRQEIAQGWDGPVSSRSVRDLVRDKQRAAAT